MAHFLMMPRVVGLKQRDFWPRTPAQSASSPIRGEDSAPLRVLIVDDEPLIRWALGETLARCGHAVVEAGDAVTALRALAATPIDVVLLDYRLPDSEGLGLLQAIRRASPDAAIIMMTAFGTPEFAEDALELGAFAVIPKPFEVDDMSHLVSRAHHAPRLLGGFNSV
jgi:DNA-binding NtrC family response regulator